MILHYPESTSVIVRVLTRGRQDCQSERRRCGDGNRGQSDIIAGKRP